jgi:hypothetical protein
MTLIGEIAKIAGIAKIENWAITKQGLMRLTLFQRASIEQIDAGNVL